MKRNIMFIVICGFCMLFNGCGESEPDYVERQEYDDVVLELEELKSQVEELKDNEEESNDAHNYEEMNGEKHINDEPTEIEKELLGDFTFSWDENNTVFLSIYKEKGNYYVYGSGSYEEDKDFLLNWNYYWLCEFTGLYANDAEIKLTLGETEYLYTVKDGNITDEYNPKNSGFGVILPEQYKEKGIKWEDKIDEFYQSTIWK